VSHRVATLLSANGADFATGATNVATQMPGSVGAISWAINNSADILNLSYGAASPTATLSAFDRYLDYVGRYLATTVVVACGNSGNFAGDPGAGYNQIAVGAFDDRGNSAWSGELMAGFSSHRNPSTGLETPQVAAPGVGMQMGACSANGFDYVSSGTSFSSPLVAGQAALIVSKQPVLKSWPEGVRAIVMATAWHNIEGARALSSLDGAGGIDARAAVLVSSRGRGRGYQVGTLTASSFDVNGYVTSQVAPASAGQRVRVSLSFDSVVTGAAYESDRLVSDLDLYVYGPNGQLVASSLSALNSFEVVEFTAPQSGNYTVRVRRFRLGNSSEYYGTAFSVSSDI
jgi:subtilisin family serine protease